MGGERDRTNISASRNSGIQSPSEIGDREALVIKQSNFMDPRGAFIIKSSYSLPLTGGFAFVYEAQDMSSGKDYALKVR